ncbi:hypothetical protein [Sinosporangium album]|uniref:hypothetical protein n=1 Tax=Sinosporangium album TaxID=504805 RepID=UPI001FE21640|nr:hypothetical protein [Sinosporangium album]
MIFSLRKNRALLSSLLGLTLAGAMVTGTATASHADSHRILLQGSTKASYFWDDSSGRNGDTGLPASGKPMQKGMFASPSWPLGTEGYVVYKGQKAPFFIGDRGPGNPSNYGVMLDIDAKTFADLTGGRFNAGSLTVSGNGGLGHINVEYVVTKWGDGYGKKNHPVAFSTGWYQRYDRNPATPPKLDTVPLKAESGKAEKASASAGAGAEKGAAQAGTEAGAAAADKAQDKAQEQAARDKAADADGAGSSSAAEQKQAVDLGGTVAAAVKTPADESGGIVSLAVLGVLIALGAGLFFGRDRIRALLVGSGSHRA